MEGFSTHLDNEELKHKDSNYDRNEECVAEHIVEDIDFVSFQLSRI